jgi:diguanylate cyclase (GGDEF)-like protein
MFIATIGINLYNTRLFLMSQLESHAQDTATSLALSLSPSMTEDDLITATTMIDAINDRGYYSHIRLESNSKETLVERHAAETLADVPDWFVQLVSLETPRAEAQVMGGWNLAGVLHVQSHPGFAYRQLWQTFIQLFFWFVGAAVFVGTIGAAFIHKLLKPLRAVEKQAQNICERNYAMQEVMPKTRELKQLVTAMNVMTGKVQMMFAEQAETAERMREMAYVDSLTGLGNRRFFDGQLNAAVRQSEKKASGALMLVQLSGLKEINDSLGFEAGDALIKAAAHIIQAATESCDAVIGRLAGADFGVLCNRADEKKAHYVAEVLSAKLAELYAQELSLSSNVAQIGITLFSGNVTTGELLSGADHALRVAQTKGPNQWSVYTGQVEKEAAVGRQEWGHRIAGALEHGNIKLFVQPVVSSGEDNQFMHREIFVRMQAADGVLLTAGEFMPIAEELGLAHSIDRMVIEKLVEFLENDTSQLCYAINLSPGSLHDDDFLSWLYNMLDKLGRENSRLVFEFPEFGVVRDMQELHRFSTQVRRLGHGIALDHFGKAFSNFGYLHSLRPDYVKIDGAYTAEILESRDDQFFVQTLCSIAHSLDILTIAEMVETEQQWKMLTTLKVDGIQGYLIDRPAALICDKQASKNSEVLEAT